MQSNYQLANVSGGTQPCTKSFYHNKVFVERGLEWSLVVNFGKAQPLSQLEI